MSALKKVIKEVLQIYLSSLKYLYRLVLNILNYPLDILKRPPKDNFKQVYIKVAGSKNAEILDEYYTQAVSKGTRKSKTKNRATKFYQLPVIFVKKALSGVYFSFLNIKTFVVRSLNKGVSKIKSFLMFLVIGLKLKLVKLNPIKPKRGRPKKLINKFPFKYLLYFKKYLLRRYKIFKTYLIRKYDDFALFLYKQMSPLFENRIRYKFVFFNASVFGLLFVVMVVSTIFYYSVIYTMPNPNKLNLYRPKQTTYIYDANQDLLYKTYKDENRTVVELAKVPTHFQKAIVAIEDSDFYSHNGISLPSMARAAYANYKSGEIVQGASTITQQLVKNTLLTNERTLDRKIKEALLSLMIETNYSKEEILEMYLNTVSFGGTSYGVQEASLMYFGKNVEDLDLAESAMLAGLPVAPSVYTPYISYDKAKERQKVVLAQMLRNNFITVEQAKAAYDEELNILYPESVKQYPHFVNYVTSYVEQKYGTQTLNSGGLKIYTSLQPDIQDMAQEIVKNEVADVARYRITNGAALVTKNKTGEVVGMVGSKDYEAEDIDGFVNVTTALRQPGSSIKPFNYSLALKNGMTASTIIRDEPVTYKVAGSPAYTPKNYDNKFRGNVTIRRALANSLNIPSVRVLEINGVSNFIEYVRLFGIDTWNRDYYGLSLALGAAEVRMVDMNGAYSVFANNGDLIKINPVLYIETASGDILEYNTCIYTKDSFKGKKILREQEPCRTKIINTGNAFIIKTILTDFKARAEAFGTNSILNVPGTGAKTGTTNDLKDNWTFGFNEEYTVGTWVGNNDGTPMSYVASGITGASPIWAKIISNLTTEENKVDISSIPSNVVKVEVCSITGQLACGACKGSYEYYIKGTVPTNKCSSRQIKEIKERKEKDEDADKDDD